MKSVCSLQLAVGSQHYCHCEGCHCEERSDEATSSIFHLPTSIFQQPSALLAFCPSFQPDLPGEENENKKTDQCQQGKYQGNQEIDR